MEDGFRPLADNANTMSRRSFKPITQVREEEVYDIGDYNADPEDIPYARQWSPRPRQEYNPPPSHVNRAYSPSAYEEDDPSVQDIDRAYTPNPTTRIQRRSVGQSSRRNVDLNPMQTPSIRLVSSTSDNDYILPAQDVTSESAPNFRRWSQRQGVERAPIQGDVDASHTSTPSIRQFSPRPDSHYGSPVQDITPGYALNPRRLSHRRGDEHNSPPHDIHASPVNTPDTRQWTPTPDDEYVSSTQNTNTFFPPSTRQEPPSFETNRRRDSFRNPEDDKKAQAILSRNKEEKIEKRSSISRMMMSKSKKTKFNQREIYRALLAVVNGEEQAGPGVVEVLLEQFQAEHGNVNFVPHEKKHIGTILKKRHEERSGLIEIAARAGNVEVVQLLSKNSDPTGLNNALEIAFRNRNVMSNRNTSREDQMIRILVSKGADGSQTIGAAAAAGDETLLSMLLDGNPPVPALSEALPEAVAFRDTETRRRLNRMLLDKGADVNYGEGEAIFRATKLFDMHVLDTLLERRPQPLSLNRAFASALAQPESNRRFEACQKLIHAGAAGDEVSKGLAIAITTENQNIAFLKLILQSASVDFEEGHALCLTVANNYQTHLKLMLEKRPNERTFDRAFEAALRLRNPRDQLKYCNILVGAGPTRDSCSKALLIAVTIQKDELCRIFLEKGASVDFKGGASITTAARSENAGILELLVGGEFQQPTNASLVPAFEVVLSLPSPFPKKKKLIQLILDAGLQGPALDAALVTVSKKGQEGLSMVKLFLDYGASVSAHGGEALDISARSGNLELLQMLLQGRHQPSPQIFSRIFQSALKLDAKTRHLAIEMILRANMAIDVQVAAALDGLVQDRIPDMQTIKVLLSFHASVHYENHRPLVTAGKTFNKTLLILLLGHSRDASAPSVVFDALMKTDSFWGKRDAFAILTLLLENGATGIAVDDALIKAVTDNQPDTRHFEVTLLQHGASIDHKDGEALQIATERGEAALVRRMLEMKPTSETVSMAFPYAYVCKLPEANALAVIDSFVELSTEELYPGFMHPEIPEPPVFLSVKHYPNNVEILAATLKAGFDIDQVMSSENGRYTALYWSLVQGKKIGDDVVEFLIRQGADLKTHTVPLLHLAIDDGRHGIIQCLIEEGVDIDLPDENDISPLVLATQKNDITSMQALLAASASANDGSLHDAARMANADAIKLLLTHGHDPNFPCVRFEGRPPLFELCLNGPAHLKRIQATTQEKEQMVEKAIQALISGGAFTQDQLPQAGQRSLLFHALDSSNPYLMTKAFLKCRQYTHINMEFNLFTDGEYTYSPTKYVEKGKCRGDKTQTQSLIKLLKDCQAIDRYWKNEGPQPPDYENAPPHIVKAEEERKEAERRKRQEEEELRRRIEREQRELAEARRKLALEEEAAQAKAKREELAFRQRQAQEARIHAANIAKENDRLKLKEAKDAHALRQAASMSKLRNDENEAEHRRRLKLIGERKSLAASQEALHWAYNRGLEQGGAAPIGPGGRKALGMSAHRSNLDLGRRLQIEGARIEEIDE
ncbi:hypothetical protein L207DRAFT_590496 [Hyaloscypha variabilis F]|uniref:Uncharacterized protein n=1 Tax=Hyaloscypha variabilis (strain UAMH 11265 / GT02V1 / F) TaxID=1149755 RepID=A0A2J6R2R1_HYAVF|nr:hypothetical protein L207DRAFT_590496 [Hyaloscypha variabilis F]